MKKEKSSKHLIKIPCYMEIEDPLLADGEDIIADVIIDLTKVKSIQRSLETKKPGTYISFEDGDIYTTVIDCETMEGLWAISKEDLIFLRN